ncbi:MAG: helix-turn-helix transcriptional regulator [Clostridia bacterium]
MDDVRRAVKTLMLTKGFSQAAIARKANIAPSKLSGILNLRRKMEANEMLALCEAMDISITDLFATDQTA